MMKVVQLLKDSAKQHATSSFAFEWLGKKALRQADFMSTSGLINARQIRGTLVIEFLVQLQNTSSK